MRNLLKTALAAKITSESSFLLPRLVARRIRNARRTRPTVEWFHRLDDAHSLLLGQALEQLSDAWEVDIIGRTISPTPKTLAPQADLLRDYAATDARQIAPHLGLEVGYVTPDSDAVERGHSLLSSVEGTTDYLGLANDIGAILWTGSPISEANSTETGALESNRRRLHRLGHYQSGMLFFEGEWFFGVDRLPLLVERLFEERLGPRPNHFLALPPPPDKPAEIEFFYSVRSPYSYLALRRALDIAEAANVPLTIRPVLPMVMRGEPVPFSKRVYLLRDAAREAHRHDIPFGRVRDPVGRGVERVIAVFVAAQAENLPAIRFLECAATAIWSQGVAVDRDRGLRKVCAEAEIPWEFASNAIRDESWRSAVEANQVALREIGHWGVPTFRVGEHVLWGQDRLWLLEWLVSG
ncbi:MAG: 2-hydroxychromene-2-carboxylate isomerase [Bradymonadia bacterium]|jgi:2-hydroxychromene-2-carboxylate isomerase